MPPLSMELSSVLSMQAGGGFLHYLKAWLRTRDGVLVFSFQNRRRSERMGIGVCDYW